jgi:uncharacterized membrane protein YphA (DoxX/SURF4 family)
MSRGPELRLWQRAYAVIIRLFIAAIFALAAWPKLLDPAAFAEAVYRYHLLPDAWVNPVAVFLPWFEIVCAIALAACAPLRGGAVLGIAAMLFVFIGAMSINLHRGLDVACGCFSVSGGESMTWWNVARNIGLLVLIVLAWRWSPQAQGSQRSSQ